MRDGNEGNRWREGRRGGVWNENIEGNIVKANRKTVDYEDQQEATKNKNGDSGEMRQLRTQLRTAVEKLGNTKREKEQIQKRNEQLQREVMGLQDSLRHTVAGFNDSTSDFPMGSQLQARVTQFLKCDCVDIFFDVLCADELSIKGVVHFFATSFHSLSALISTHFQPLFAALRTGLCRDSLQGPLLHVLRKALQSRHSEVFQRLTANDPLSTTATTLQRTLDLNTKDSKMNESLHRFLTKLLQILLLCFVADPPLSFQMIQFGRKVSFNGLHHEAFDGFIRAKDDCFIVLPEVYRNNELVLRAQVLRLDYDMGQ